MIKRVLVGILAFTVFMFLFWYSGVDFMVRSAANAWCIAMSLVMASLASAYPE